MHRTQAFLLPNTSKGKKLTSSRMLLSWQRRGLTYGITSFNVVQHVFENTNEGSCTNPQSNKQQNIVLEVVLCRCTIWSIYIKPGKSVPNIPTWQKIVYDFSKSMKASVNINMLIMMPCEVIGRIYLPFMGFNKNIRN